MANPQSNKPQFPCDECGNLYRKPYLYTHMRAAHGIRGGKTGVIRNDHRAVAAAPSEGTITVPIASNAPVHPRFKVLDSMIVLTDQNGSLWIGEKIRD